MSYFDAPLAGGSCAVEFGGVPVLTSGVTLDSPIESYESQTFCLQVDNEGSHTITVSSDFDAQMEVNGPFGSPDHAVEYYYADDTIDVDPQISQYFVRGAYQVIVNGYEGSSGFFNIEVTS